MRQVNEIEDSLVLLGQRLRAARLKRNDTMQTFAERLGVSQRTIRAMEQGLPTVQIGTWINALWILDRLDEVALLLRPPSESLLDRVRNDGKPARQRASRRSP